MSVYDAAVFPTFPNIIDERQPDANTDNWIDSTDATLILQYSAYVNANPNGEDTYTGPVHQPAISHMIS